MNPLARGLLDGSIRDGETAAFRYTKGDDEIHLKPNHEPLVVSSDAAEKTEKEIDDDADDAAAGHGGKTQH